MKTPTRARPKQGTLFGSFPLIALLTLFPLPAIADEVSLQQVDLESVPARIRTLEGTAILQRGLEQDRVHATINSPIFPGDSIQIDQGRAEVEFPDGSILWLDSGTRLELLGIRDDGEGRVDNTVLRLLTGTVEVDYREKTSGAGEDARIDTPESSIYLLGRGRFRVESNHGVTSLISLRGVAELAGDSGSILVRSGQKSQVWLGSVPEAPEAVNTLRLDDFDRWCEERTASYLAEDEGEDRQYVQAVPVPVRHYVTELDNYGDWQWMVDFGWVWRPTIYQVGWRPYVNGYWISAPRGWNWVAHEPWGWVPYHYGRWSWVTSAGWVWIPGGSYSGAWVSWAVTPTYVGWCPLDYYNRPAYVHINVSNVTVNRYGGGWNFLPLNRFCDRGAARMIVRPDRVPNLHGAITTRELPRFSPNQIRTRPDLSRQILRESAKSQYLLEAPATGRDAGQTSFRQAERREMVQQRGGEKERDAPVIRPEPSAPSPRPGRREVGTRPQTPLLGKGATRAQDPHALPGAAREQAESKAKTEWSRPSRETVRVAPPAGAEPGASVQRGRQGGQDGIAVRPRRESTPSVPLDDSRDASRRVLDRIFGGNTGPAGLPGHGAAPADPKLKQEKGRIPQVENSPGQRPSQPKAGTSRPRSQPPRHQTSPPPKEEAGKDKP